MKTTCTTTRAAVTIAIMTMALCFAGHDAAVSARATPSSSSSFLRGGGTGGRGLAASSPREENRIGRSSMNTNNLDANSLVIAADPEEGSDSDNDVAARLVIVASEEEEDNDDDGEPCTVHVTLTCPAVGTEEPIAIDNDCIDPFRTMTLRYNGGDCAQSDNLQARQEFSCTDSANPPNPPAVPEGTEHYVVVTSRDAGGINDDGRKTYFAGPVKAGDEYTLNADGEFSVLSDAVTIIVYESEGGNALQVTDVLLDCSRSLFLFDRFGSSQVTAWTETSGRVVSSSVDTKRTGSVGVTVDNRDSTMPIRLSEMTLLSNTQDQPVSYTDDVRNSVLQPEGVLETLPGFEFEYDLANRTRYTFFTTVIAEPLVGGSSPSNQCNSYASIECIL